MSGVSFEFLPFIVLSIAGGLLAVKIRRKTLIPPLIMISLAPLFGGFTAEYYCDRSLLNMGARLIRGDAACSPNISQQSQNPSPKPPLVNFVSAIEPLTIPSNVDWTIRAWGGLVPLMPWLNRPINRDTGKKWPIFQSCEHADRRGLARFQFDSFSPMNFTGDEVIDWQVLTCGPRAGLSRVEFHSDHTRGLEQIFSGIEADLKTRGYQITYLGCEGLNSDPTSFYHVSRQDIRPFVLKLHYFHNVSNSLADITIYFQPLEVQQCERNIDLLSNARN